MSHVSSDHPRESAKTLAASSERPDKLSRPGWLEIIVGLIVMGGVSVGVATLAGRLDLSPVVYGLIPTTKPTAPNPSSVQIRP